MSNILDQIKLTENTKENIKKAIIEKGIEVLDTDKFSEYPDKINQIPLGEDIQDYISTTSDSTAINGYNASVQLLYRIKKLPKLDLRGILSQNIFLNLFIALKELTELPEIVIDDNIDTFNLGSTFDGCKKLTNIDNIIKLIENKKVINLQNTFRSCSNITDFSFLSNIDTSELTNLNNTFYSCVNCTEIPFFDTSKVTNMNSTFSNCPSLITIPKFDTSKVTNMGLLLAGCTSLKSIPELDCSSCNIISSVFYTASLDNFTDLGGFKNLGKAYTQKQANYNNYTLTLSSCSNLTKESLLNVINNLYDLNITYGAETSYVQSLVLGSNKSKLSEEEIAIATNKGWVVS